MHKTAKYLVTLSALFTIVIPSIMDLNHTHMTNPLWAPHARFHWSIQWYSITMLNCIALFLLWGRYQDKGSRISFVMAALSPLLFWGNFFPSLLMPGTSPWPDGMVPFASTPPNVYMAAVVSLVCLIAIFLDGRSRNSLECAIATRV